MFGASHRNGGLALLDAVLNSSPSDVSKSESVGEINSPDPLRYTEGRSNAMPNTGGKVFGELEYL